MAVPARTIEPEADNDGYYFVCPSCEGRNRLVNTGQDDNGGAGLGQPDV